MLPPKSVPDLGQFSGCNIEEDRDVHFHLNGVLGTGVIKPCMDLDEAVHAPDCVCASWYRENPKPMRCLSSASPALWRLLPGELIAVHGRLPWVLCLIGGVTVRFFSVGEAKG